MASATVVYVRIEPRIAARVKAKAKREGISLAAATEAAYQLYLNQNGSDATSPEANARAATKGA